jgi:hypothetical protein
MKKLILILLSSYVIFANAQNIEVLNYNPIVYGAATDGTKLESTATIKNNASYDIDAKVKRDVVFTVAGSSNNFCWGPSCYPPNISMAVDVVTIASGGTDASFKGDYEPKGNVGNSIINYCFFDLNNDADSACITIEFRATPVGVFSAKSSSIKFFPNPVSSSIWFDGLKENMLVNILSLEGKLLQTILVNATTNQIDLKNLNAGLYILQIQNGENIQSHKFLKN